MRTINILTLAIAQVALVRSLKGSPEEEEFIETFPATDTTDAYDNEDATSEHVMEQIRVFEDTPRILNGPALGSNPVMVDPPGTWREASPITSELLTKLDVAQSTRLYGLPGSNSIVRFELTNLSNVTKTFYVHANEYETRNSPRLKISLSPIKTSLQPGSTQPIVLNIEVPNENYVSNARKVISLEVQPKGENFSFYPISTFTL